MELAVDHTLFLPFSFAKSLTLLSCYLRQTRTWNNKVLFSISYQNLLVSTDSSQISQQTFTQSSVTPLFWCFVLMLSSKLFSKYSFYWFKNWEKRTMKEDVITIRKKKMIKKHMVRKKKMIKKLLMILTILLILWLHLNLIMINRRTPLRRKKNAKKRRKNNKDKNSKLNVPQSKNTLIFMEVMNSVEIGGSLSSWFSSTWPWCLAQPFHCYSLFHLYHAWSTITSKSFWYSNSIMLNNRVGKKECVKTCKQLDISKLHH